MLRNFKSARDLKVPFKPLTVLSGLNGSGKSTVLQALALLRQSMLLARSISLPSLHLRGPLVQLGNGKDVLSEGAAEEAITIGVQHTDGHAKWQTQVVPLDSNVIPIGPTEGATFEALANTERLLRFCNFQYLQADRLTPQVSYTLSDVDSLELGFLGAHGEFTPDYLAQHGELLEVSARRRCPMDVPGLSAELAERITATPKLYHQISGWLQHVSPGVRFEAMRYPLIDLVTLQYSYASSELAKDSEWRRPTNVGFGLTYCLPIITACLAAPEDSILLLENPEAHLHPRGQTALGSLLAKCAADGVQIIVETHSDHVLNGIRLAAKTESIDADQIQLCNFVREPVSGDSYIETPMVLPDGGLTAWPSGFFDEWEKTLDELLR